MQTRAIFRFFCTTHPPTTRVRTQETCPIHTTWSPCASTCNYQVVLPRGSIPYLLLLGLADSQSHSRLHHLHARPKGRHARQGNMTATPEEQIRLLVQEWRELDEDCARFAYPGVVARLARRECGRRNRRCSTRYFVCIDWLYVCLMSMECPCVCFCLPSIARLLTSRSSLRFPVCLPIGLLHARRGLRGAQAG